ncbi:MAG TPA: signal peptidase I [Nocardioidaceae bacterium]|nr:signal peptidase I [Nocardioidaceae bacterium]
MTSIGDAASEGRPDAAAGGRFDAEHTSAPSVPREPSSSSGARTGRRKKRPSARRPMPVWQETVLLLGTAIVLALLIKTFFVQAFYIPSGSMRDTLKVDDRILVEKMSYWWGDIHRGDIVVFDDPANWLGEEDGEKPTNPVTKALSVVGLYPTGGHLVKRVIGVGGDTVACRTGSVYVNDVKLSESSYVTLPVQACDGSWSYVVPADRLWVMGDNREHSADSRAHVGDPGGGFIPVDDVVGKVFVVVWPLDRFGFVHRPGTFDNPELDQAAGLVTSLGMPGLALIAMPPLYRRLRRKPDSAASSASSDQTSAS